MNNSPFALKKIDEKMPKLTSVSNLTFKVTSSEIFSPKFTKKWSVIYDDSFLLDKSLNTISGEVCISIPLVDIQITPTLAIIYDLTYDQRSKAFKSQLLDDFISINRQKSVFEQDFIYNLNMRGFESPLKRTNNDNEFSLDLSDVLISFDPLKQQWIIENSLERAVYGYSAGNGAVKHGLTFNNWGGSGSNASGLSTIPLTWYIAERHSKAYNSSVYYKYRVTEETFPTTKAQYSSGILLEEISTGSQGMSIKFGYEIVKDSKKKKFLNGKGSLELQNLMLDDRNLISVFIETKEYEQRFELQWINKNLSTFLQKLVNSTENLVEFKYNDENFLSEIKTIRGTTINYEYGDQEMKFSNDERSFPIHESPSVGSCGNFIIFVTKLSNELLDVEIIDSITMLVAQKLRIPANLKSVSPIEIRSFGQDFLISYRSALHSIIKVFQFLNVKQNFDNGVRTFFYKKDSEIQFSSNFVVIHESDSVKILEVSNWNTQQFKFQSSIKITTNSHFVAVHEGENLHLIHKIGEKWTQKLLKSGFVSNAAAVLNKFDITEELRKDLSKLSFRFQEGFQTSENVILWLTVKENLGKFHKILHILMLDTHFNIARETKITRFVENIYQLSEETIDTSSGVKYSLGYIHTLQNKYRVVIRSMCCDAEIAKAIGTSNKNRIFDAKIEKIKESNKNDSETAQNLRQTFLSSSDAKYRVILTSNGIYLGNRIVFKFNGADWLEENLPARRVVELGENFEIEFDTSDVNLIKLIDKKENTTRNLNIYNQNSLVNSFPLYIAYQSSELTTNAIFFDKGSEIISEKTFDNEKLLTSSNYRQIMTIRNSTITSSDPFEVLLRSTGSFMPKISFPVVIEERRTSKDEVRLKRFERDFTTNTQKLITIPSDTKASHGWIEQVLAKDRQETKYYDADGIVVKTEVRNKNEEEEDFRKTYADNLLYDTSKTLQISNFYPYKLSDDEADFYAFESYEKSEKWDFDTTNLIKHETSLTGTTFLRLNSSNSTVTRSFTPKNQKGIFTASAWIRAPHLHEITQFFKAVMSIGDEELFGLYGQVVNKVGEWSQVAVNIDLVGTVKKIYDEKRAVNSTEVAEYHQSIFTIKLVASGTENLLVDFDSIAFHPISHRLEANVYNEAGKVVSTLNADSSISKFFFNPLNGKNFARTKDDKIEHLTVAGESLMIKLTPQNGFHEHFGVLSRWTISNLKNFSLFDGKLHHSGNLSSIKSKDEIINEDSAAIRFEYAIDSDSSVDLKFLDFDISINSQNWLFNGEIVGEIPSHGEILILKHEKRLAVWINGKSMLEQLTRLRNSWKSFEISCTGKTSIRDLFVLNRPLVKLYIFNNWNNEKQVIKLESDGAAIVTEKIYDEIGRELFTTKPTKVVTSEPLLVHHNNFIKNVSPQNGTIEGLVSDLNPDDEGFPYSQTVYHKNPLGEKKVQGLPGKDFSASGKFSVKFEKITQNPFINAYFPISNGFKHRVEHLSNGSSRVLIFDKNEKKVAKYVEVPGFEHLLSTYEYDDEMRIMKILPPSYHEDAKTFEKINAVYQDGNSHLNGDQVKMQQKLGTHLKYDKRGNLIEKSTPDEGLVTLFYTSNDQLKFTKYSDGKIIFFNYNHAGLLSETGSLDESFSNEILKKLVDVDSLVSANPFQQIVVNDEEDTKLIITTNHNKPIFEELKFDKNEKITSQKLTTMSQSNSTESTYEVKRTYEGEKVKLLTYPASDVNLKVLHTYNNLGQLVSVGTTNDPTAFATFTYNANNQIESENHPANKIERSFGYNSPGFLQTISDKHLTEKISYIEGGYGQQGYGDGIVMKTTFDAAWSEKIDHEFDLSPYDEDCIDFLRDSDYIDDSNHFKKLFKSHVETKTPLNCKEKKIFDELSAKFQVPSHYGHRYAYGTHRELVKSKYFSNEEEAQIDPLQPVIYCNKIEGVSEEMSLEIWKIMKENKFVAVDKRRNDNNADFGARGIHSMVKDEEMRKELKELSNVRINFEIFAASIKRLIYHAIEMKQGVDFVHFKELFLSWNEATDGVTRVQQNEFIKSAEKLYKKLTEKKFLPVATEDLKDILSTKLRTSLIKYENYILDIVKATSIALNHDLLTTSFDTSSYNIDANGNHKKFFTGFKQVDIKYEENSNKISSLKIYHFGDLSGRKEFKIDHDSHGNVLNAPHHGVERFKYHPVSQRVTDVELTDGRRIQFHYNGQGERLLKQVFNAMGLVEKETFYIRDEQGNVLMDKVTTFKDNKSEEVSTHYIYGPRGLIGFVRNDTFHSVFTDHSGSVRLVIKNGEVVAVYDYLPYGELMRKFVTDETAEIAYKFNGKELDDETQTYNFHARFYDPLLGRFLQIDPQSQYFSPYKFSGNSPVSFVDPDGEFVLLLTCIALAAAGAYLGGAAANNRWNPITWDYRDRTTYFGMGIGAIIGGLAPLGAVSSAGFIAGAVTGLGATSAYTVAITGTAMLGVGGAYLSASASASSWNPAKWKWDGPDLYFALFSGTATGSGFVGSFADGRAMAIKYGLLKTSYASAALFVYAGISMEHDEWRFWKWDAEIFLKPETYLAMVEGIEFGLGMPGHLKNGCKNFLTFVEDPKLLAKALADLSSNKIKRLKVAFTRPNHPLYKAAGVILLTHYSASVTNDGFEPSNWSNSATSYKTAFFHVMRGIHTLKLANFAVRNGNMVYRVPTSSKISKNHDLKIKHSFLSKEFKTFDEMKLKNYGFIARKLKNEINRESRQMIKVRERFIDRDIKLIEKCPNRNINETHCILLPEKTNIRQDLLRDEFLFDEDNFLETHPILIDNSTSFNAVHVKDSNRPILLADPSKLSTVKFEVLKLHSKMFIPYDGSERMPIVTDGSADVSIYFKQIIQEGVLGVEILLHKDVETETKIHLNNCKLNRKEFLESLTQLSLNTSSIYFDVDGQPIKELLHLENSNQLELYDVKNHRLDIVRGCVRIPNDGIKYRNKESKIQDLKTINGKNVAKIQEKNLKIQKSKKDYSLNYSFVVRWEDLSASDDNYKIINQFKSSLFPITIQFSKEGNRWRVISHNMHEDSPKVFDTPFAMPYSLRRTRRSLKNPRIVIVEYDSMKKPLQITSNSTKKESQQSILDLGDTWLNSTDINSNLLLAYALIKRWSHEKLNFNSTNSDMAMTSTECDIFASNAMYDFNESLIKISLNCGIPKVIRDILNELEMPKIIQNIKEKCEKNSIELIGKLLIEVVVEKNKWKIISRSSEKQFQRLLNKIKKSTAEFNEKLLKIDDKRWTRVTKIH